MINTTLVDQLRWLVDKDLSHAALDTLQVNIP
jgi:hypothetical protein